MEAYYQQQSVSPYFSGHYRQRGSGFGASVLVFVILVLISLCIV